MMVKLVYIGDQVVTPPLSFVNSAQMSETQQTISCRARDSPVNIDSLN